MNKILVTGGAGFIGSHVVDAVVARYPCAQICVLDKLNYAANINFIIDHLQSRRVAFMAGDITDYPAMLSATHGVDLVLNLAAESHVGRSFSNSMEFTRTNTLGTHVILEASRQQNVARFIHVSTDEVYGEVLADGATEEHPLHPNNPYSGSKAAAEMIIQSYWRSFGTNAIIVRANNIFGPRQFPEKIIPRFIMHAMDGKKLPLHGNGTHRRYYLAAQDFAAALLIIAESGELRTAYNVGTEEEYSNFAIAEMICRQTGRDPSTQIAFEADRPFNDRRYALNTARINSLGWSSRHRLAIDLPDLVTWYRDNRHMFAQHFNTNTDLEE
jgi:UDP-glucose 4,6-dehydratase